MKSFIAKSSIDREFALHEQIQLLKRESCESLEDYLRQHKLLCDEVAAIGKALSKDRKAFWMLILSDICHNDAPTSHATIFRVDFSVNQF